MLRGISVLSLAVFLIGAFACAGSNSNRQTRGVSQPVVFQRSFINYAWGYQNRGWFIDQNGAMRTYKAPSEDQWRAATRSGPDSGYISRQDLEANLALAEKEIYQVPIEELRQKAGLIDEAAGGSLCESIRQAYDAGEFRNVCYYWDKDRGMYKEVLLSRAGDWYQINYSLGAIQLDSWLNGLDNFYTNSPKNSP